MVKTFGEFLKGNVPKYRIADIMQYAAIRYDIESNLPKSYKVPSFGSPEDVIYTVTNDQINKKWSCTCCHHYYRIKSPVSIEHACKHSNAVYERSYRFYPGK